MRREYPVEDSPWRVIEFRVQDPRFRNSQNGRADFRIYDNETGFYLRRVSVYHYRREPMRPRDPSGLRGITDLKGKRIAFPGNTNTTLNFNAQQRLGLAGISASELAQYEFIDVGLESSRGFRIGATVYARRASD
jgi:TRAP-type uncharacterized transport system substrate-binding protein